MIRGLITAVLGAALGTLAAAASALGAATLTYPTDGMTVRLDKQASFDFRWTLPAGETAPMVYVGDTPKYNPDPFYSYQPFEQICGFDDGQVGYSCRPPRELPLPPGSHYAVVSTTGADNSVLTSPEVHFFVPYALGWGCTPLQRACEFRAIDNYFVSNGDASYPSPYQKLLVWAWFNGTKLKATLTLRQGRRVVARFGQLAEDGGYGQFDVGFGVYRLPGLSAGTPLRATLVLHGGNRTLTRMLMVHAGGGPRGGVHRF